MRCGIVILPEHRWEQQRSLWVRAEELGFDHAWTYDHLVWAGLPDAPWFGAVPTLAAAATATRSIRLGTFVASPNFRHPVTFMRELLALDDISGGRFVCGLGVGADLDARLIGQPEWTVRERVGRFAEFVDLLDRLLREDHVTVDGTWFRARDARSLPGCLQRPRVPFAIAANGRRNLRVAARFGQAWVTFGSPGCDEESWWAGLRELQGRLDDELEAAGRARGDLDRILSVDGGGVYSLSTVGRFTEVVGRAEDLGFTDVVTHWPRQAGVYAGSVEVLEQVATEVLPTLS